MTRPRPPDDLRPSAKLIYTILAYEGECSRQDILNRATLPEGTVDRELQELDDEDHIVSRIDPSDPNAHLYRLANIPQENKNRQHSGDASVL